MKTISSTFLTKLAVAALIPACIAVACKKDEPPPPLPSATAPPPVATPATLTVEEPPVAVMDAGTDAGDAGKPKGTGSSASLARCCTALTQNAASAPPQSQQAMLAAAGICNALVQQGKDRNSIVSAITGALRGASMPAACR